MSRDVFRGLSIILTAKSTFKNGLFLLKKSIIDFQQGALVSWLDELKIQTANFQSTF